MGCVRMSNRQTTYIHNEQVLHGWEHEPDDCRREPTWSTCAICEDGGWVRSKIDGKLVYCRCEVGQWTREQDVLATDEPGMVVASAEPLRGHGEVVIDR